jgi:hydroxylamine reductase (hybrid-cluster protein)
MAEERGYGYHSVWSAEVVAASGTATSGVYDLTNKEKGVACLHIKLTGSGTVTIAYEKAGKIPSAAGDFVTGANLATGVVAGTYCYAVDVAAAAIRFKVTETGTEEQVVISEAYFYAQARPR